MQSSLSLGRFSRDLHNFKVQRKLCEPDFYQSHAVPLAAQFLLLCPPFRLFLFSDHSYVLLSLSCLIPRVV